MKRREITGRLMATFLGELEEQTAMMNDELLGLEAAPTETERLGSLFRIAHTLKGASRAVEVRSIERVCHALEGLIQRMIDGSVGVGPDQLSLLYAAADTLSETGVLLGGNSAVEEARMDALINALRSGSPERLHTAAPRPQPRPVSAGAGLPRRPDGADTPPSDATLDGSAEAEALSGPQPPPARTEPERQVRVDARRLDELVAATTRLETARSEMVTRHADLANVSDLAA
ncbi:MAG: Hpt domain-containing protein, partial [Longimicrobiales bacterium]